MWLHEAHVQATSMLETTPMAMNAEQLSRRVNQDV